MKLRLLICTALLVLLAIPVFADSLSFTNQGGLSVNSTGISANSTMTSFSVNGTQILSGNIGTVDFNTGTFTGSLTNGGSFTGGDFSFGLTGSSVIFVNNFTGTLTKIGQGLYDLAGTFSGVSSGIAFFGSTNQIFSVSSEDDGDDLRGTTTISAVPEPGTLTFLGTGLIALTGVVRRKLVART